MGNGWPDRLRRSRPAGRTCSACAICLEWQIALRVRVRHGCRSERDQGRFLTQSHCARSRECAHSAQLAQESVMPELTLKAGLEAMDVADYLRRNPKFLKDFPDIAQELVIPREHGPAASLTAYQLEALRAR